tara:strand:- start:68 stop:352 length:285 start_codon:yes stop_codon:yes gene_type:complete
MVDKTRRDQILQSAEQRKRSSFREEFYREGDDKKPARKKANQSRGRKRKRKLPVWTYVATFGILFCVLAVIGSSAMIWLRKLGAVFGVYWEGDF